MNIVWFKRDLRLHDHAALINAFKIGDILPLYILEPQLWREADMSRRQYLFLIDSLSDLDQALRARGQGLIIKIGEAVDVLEALHRRHRITSLWSHQETWNGWTYARDRAVKKWTKEAGISWFEPTQHGVMRRLHDRDGWASAWEKTMRQPLHPAPQKLQPIAECSDPLPTPDSLGLEDDGCYLAQKGGRGHGLKTLQSFLHARGEGYTREMSSPVTAFESCSRLSPHLAFGTLSMREVFQAAETRAGALSTMPYNLRGQWPSALRSFIARLHWHCHFIQKLEDEPRIEFENMHSACDNVRPDATVNDDNAHFFQAWQKGQTGYPMIDASMRALTATGWLNFRMRAMLMSFASYHLWLHWRRPALHLARLFIDYEPGIHYSQVQMQSGTTGINSIRIYNPIKQGIDHDPNGSFIRQWVPELVPLDNRFIHTPWLAMAEGQMSFNGYPRPIVDEKDARQSAAARLYGLRKQTDHATTARAIVQKHASRKGDSAKNNASKTSHHKKRNRPSQSPAKSETQITFSFED